MTPDNHWKFGKVHIQGDVQSIESIETTSMETVSTGVLDENKEHYLRSKDKAENDMMYQDTYNCICQNQ